MFKFVYKYIISKLFNTSLSELLLEKYNVKKHHMYMDIMSKFNTGSFESDKHPEKNRQFVTGFNYLSYLCNGHLPFHCQYHKPQKLLVSCTTWNLLSFIFVSLFQSPNTPPPRHNPFIVIYLTSNHYTSKGNIL